MHYSIINPKCSTFRIITANFLCVSEILGFSRYFLEKVSRTTYNYLMTLWFALVWKKEHLNKEKLKNLNKYFLIGNFLSKLDKNMDIGFFPWGKGAHKQPLRYPKQVAQRATIAHLSPICQCQISFQKIQTHPSFNACFCYMKVPKGSNQKQERKSGNTIFPIIRSIGVFLRRSRAANSVVGGPIWPKFELIHNSMQVLVTSKFEKDRININRDYVMTLIF